MESKYKFLLLFLLFPSILGLQVENFCCKADPSDNDKCIFSSFFTDITKRNVQVFNLTKCDPNITYTKYDWGECKMNFIPNATFNYLPGEVYNFTSSSVLELLSKPGFKNPTQDQNFRVILSLNSIKTIPNSAFLGLSQMYHLDLSNNKINQIENDAFAGLSSLTSLDISKNKLTKISANSTFAIKSSLKILLLSDNQIENIFIRNEKSKKVEEGALVDFVTLEILDLTNNKIEGIEENSLPKMKRGKLYLVKNKIRILKNNAFSSASGLEHLDLSNNLINMIEKNAFQNCTSLSKLYLSGNQLEKLENNLLISQKSLSILEISNNYLTHFDINSLESSQNMKTLSIDRNRLKSLKGHNVLKKKSPALTCLGLQYNYWNCEYFAEVLHSLMEQNISVKCGGHFENTQDMSSLCRHGFNFAKVNFGCTTVIYLMIVTFAVSRVFALVNNTKSKKNDSNNDSEWDEFSEAGGIDRELPTTPGTPENTGNVNFLENSVMFKK